MSPARHSARTRTGEQLLALYPEPWRERYGDEMRALLEDDPPGARGLGSLLGGAAAAHVHPRRPWRDGLSAGAAMRLSVGALFACWMLVSVAGAAFAKLTEHFDSLQHEHPVLSGARDAIVLGACIGAAAIAIGGLPLVWQALDSALRRRDRRLALLLASPAIAGAALIGLAVVLASLAPARGAGFPAAFVLGLLVPVALGAIGCALVGALAPKAVMRRAQPPEGLLRLAAWAGQALTCAILLVAGGIALYVAVLWSVPGAGADASGPLGLSTRVTLCFALAAAALTLWPAVMAGARARRAALSRS